MVSLSIVTLFKAASVHPLLQAFAVILGTFILEDAATVLAAMQVQDGRMSAILALASLYAGIIAGDFGLYGVGRVAGLWPWARRFLPPERRIQSRNWIEKRVFRVVFLSRFVPGARLPTYTSCGYLGASFGRFALAAVVATSIWTTLLFFVARHVGQFLIDHLGAWRWAGAVVFALVVVLIGRLIIRLQGNPG